jgi:phosphatidylglycerol:prolipoprotein diacylglycerol transferase
VIATISWPTVGTIHVGPLAIRPHGVLIAAGFLAGALLMRRATRKAGIADETLWRILEWSLVGGLVGMRVAWLAGNWDEVESIVDVFAVWHGGMSLLGGLAGGVLVGGFMVRRAGLPLVPMLDMAAPGIALGIAIGRVSDLIIGDHLGKATTLPWGFRYVGGNHPLAGSPDIGAVVHPVALYDFLITTVLLVVLLLFARRIHAPGSVIALFTLWYAGSRVLTDFLRTDTRRLFGLTGSQIASVLAVAAVVSWLAYRARRGAPRPAAAAVP